MDNAYKGLLFKEWKMMRGFFIGMFVIGIIFFLISDLSAQTPIQSNLIELMSLGFVILPGAVLFSLNMEVNQMQLFLYNPQSIHKLIFVKILNGLFFASSYLFILVLAITGMNLITGTSFFSSVELFVYLLYFILQILIITIYPTIILFFLWTLHQIWRTYVRGISIVFVIVVMIAGTKLLGFLHDSDFYNKATNWGSISIPIQEYYLSPFAFGVSSVFGTTIYLGVYVFNGIIVVLLYLLSAYLLDRKVEV